MLNIVITNELSPIGDCYDIDAYFQRYMLKGIPNNNLNKTLIKEIERGTYLTNFAILDRFKDKLSIENISSGCKASLLVANTDLVVDLLECGKNAIDSIIRNCKKGSIIIHSLGETISKLYSLETFEDIDEPISVMLDNKPFTSIDSLNAYLEEVYIL